MDQFKVAEERLEKTAVMDEKQMIDRIKELEIENEDLRKQNKKLGDENKNLNWQVEELGMDKEILMERSEKAEKAAAELCDQNRQYAEKHMDWKKPPFLPGKAEEGHVCDHRVSAYALKIFGGQTIVTISSETPLKGITIDFDGGEPQKFLRI